MDELSITPSTKVSALLDHYPELEDVLIAMAPPFKKLRNPILRKSVAKVASLRQAAAAARLPVEKVVNDLRAAVGQDPLTDEKAGDIVDYLTDRPGWFDSERVVASIDEREGSDVDEMTVRAVLQNASELTEGEILELITTFVPAPGIDLMRKKGFRTWSTEDGADVVRTYFTKPSRID